MIEMSKTEVEEKRLGAYVVMPDGIEIAFKTWWRSLVPVTVIRVRYPHDRHGMLANLLILLRAQSCKTS